MNFTLMKNQTPTLTSRKKVRILGGELSELDPRLQKTDPVVPLRSTLITKMGNGGYYTS